MTPSALQVTYSRKKLHEFNWLIQKHTKEGSVRESANFLQDSHAKAHYYIMSNFNSIPAEPIVKFNHRV